jgi:hypothetical protein
LGTAYIDGKVVGSFTAEQGDSGDVELGSVDVGVFEPLNVFGFVYIHTVLVGTYTLGAGGVGVGPSDLIYLEKLYEVRVYLYGSSDYWNYTRYGLKDAVWQEADPWVSIPIPGGTPVRQDLSTRYIENGVLRCYDDNIVNTLFRGTDVQAAAGNQYLISPSSIDRNYSADKVVFVYKGTKVDVPTAAETEVTVWYTFTNFRVEPARFTIDENNRSVWEIGFNADDVQRTEI